MSTFISYSRADSEFAVRLAKDLKAARFDVWLDQLDIPTGARWDDEVEIALASCTTFMIVLSPESLQSQNVKDEIGFAVDSGKNVLPLKIKSGDIPFRLRRFQYVDFSKQSYQDSLKEIKSLLSASGPLNTGSEMQGRAAESGSPPYEQREPATKSAAITRPNLSAVKPQELTGPFRSPFPPAKVLAIGAAAVATLVIVGLVVRSLDAQQPAPTPIPSAVIVMETPTEAPPSSPTAEISQAALQSEEESGSFVTEFLIRQNLNDWEYFVIGEGRTNKVNVSTSADGLVFSLDDPDLHAYYVYKPVSYDDVSIRLQVENLGQNTHIVGLVCRKTADMWYEFSVTGGGVWQLYNYNGKYELIVNGGSEAINYGKSINEYEMICTDSELSLRINGQTIITHEVKEDIYTRGQVGFNISAGTIYPINMRVIEVEVTEQS